jgi:hypothetical protein
LFPKTYEVVVIIFAGSKPNPSQMHSQMHTPTADSGTPDPYRSIKYCHHIPVAY